MPVPSEVLTANLKSTWSEAGKCIVLTNFNMSTAGAVGQNGHNTDERSRWKCLTSQDAQFSDKFMYE